MRGTSLGFSLFDERAEMEFDKQFVLDELKKQGQNERVQNAIQELPDKIDHEKHAALLEKFGIDPGKLVASAMERETGAPTASKPT